MTEPTTQCPAGHVVPTRLVRQTSHGLVCPACAPMWVTPEAARRPRRNGRGKALTLVAAVLALAGIGLAAFLAFTPLPTQLGGQAFCGPGYSSESPVTVALNPDSVNQGGASSTFTPTTAQLDAFKNLCSGVASTRLHWAGAWLAAGVVLGVALLIPSRACTQFLYA